MSEQRSARSWLIVLPLLVTTACNVGFPVEVKECRDTPTDVRVNEQGDHEEFTGHPLAAAALGNGRVLVAFSAQGYDEATGEVLTSEVRIALLDQATGAPVTLCATSKRDHTLSSAGAFAFGASVAPVDLTISGSKAVALVSWTEGASLPQSFVEMRFIDGAGCELAYRFRPYAGPAFASSIAWSEPRHAVLATLHDQQRVYRAWVRSEGPADAATLVTGQSGVYGFPVGAVASDGSSMIVWGEQEHGVRGMLLDIDGNPRAPGATAGPDSSFPIDLPRITPDAEVRFSLSIAADEQFVVAAEQRTVNRSVPSRVMAREYALDGTALQPAAFLDPDDTHEQWSPTLRYAPGGTLVAVWDSKAAGGTVGRLFGAGGTARFNTISCDDGPFSVGARAETQFGFPSLVVANDSVLVFHSAPGSGDSRGSATLMWKDDFSDLWPGPL